MNTVSDESHDAAMTPPGADVKRERALRRRLWGSRQYRVWFLGDSLNQVGTFVGAFAFTLLGYQVAGDVLTAGIIGSASAAAQCLMLLPGGVLMDHTDRRRLLVAAAAVVALLWLLVAGLLWAGTMSVALLLALAIGTGAVAGAFENLTDVMLPQIVTGDLLPEATAANEGRDAGLQLGASPLSGLLFGVHPSLPFIVSAIARAGQMAAALSLRGSFIPGRQAGLARPSWTAGIRWLLRWRQPRTLVLLIAGVNLSLALSGMTIILSQQQLGTAPWQIGVIQTFQGVGVLLGALLLMGMLPRLTGARIIRMSIYTIGIAVGAAMLTRDPWTIAMLGLLASLPIIPLNAVQGAFLALQIPDQLRGRVLSASTLVTAVLVAPAPLLAGALLDALGYEVAIGVAAVLLLSIGTVALLSRSVGAVPMSSEFDECEPLGESDSIS